MHRISRGQQTVQADRVEVLFAEANQKAFTESRLRAARRPLPPQPLVTEGEAGLQLRMALVHEVLDEGAAAQKLQVQEAALARLHKGRRCSPPAFLCEPTASGS